MRIPISASLRRPARNVRSAWLALVVGLVCAPLLARDVAAQTGPETSSRVSDAEDVSPMDKYRDFTPAEIAALPDPVRLDEVPIQYIFAAQGYDDPQGFELVHSLKLQTLMYDTTRSFDAAVRDFQRDLGENPTGVLTVSQIAELTYRNGLLKLGRVELLNAVRAHALTEESATAQGTWAASAETTLMPINEVRIRCDQAQAVCEESTTYVVIPGRESWDMSYLVLNTRDVYDVTRWRRQGLEAMRMAGCRQVILTLTREGSVTRRPGELLPEQECTLTLGEEREAAPDLLQTVELTDGAEIMRAQYQRLQELAFSYLRPAFRERLERWRETAAQPPAAQ